MQVLSQIRAAIDSSESLPESMVIPICGQWALLARQLKYWIDDSNLKQKVVKCLRHYNEYPCGQAENLDNLPSDTLARRLENASGLLELESRYSSAKLTSVSEIVHSDILLHRLGNHACQNKIVLIWMCNGKSAIGVDNYTQLTCNVMVCNNCTADPTAGLRKWHSHAQKYGYATSMVIVSDSFVVLLRISARR